MLYPIFVGDGACCMNQFPFGRRRNDLHGMGLTATSWRQGENVSRGLSLLIFAQPG